MDRTAAPAPAEADEADEADEELQRALQESLRMSGGGPGAAQAPPSNEEADEQGSLRYEAEEEEALRWAQAESLKATQDAGLPDLMLESELRQATQLSLRQRQAEEERLRQQEEAELARALEASLQSAPSAARLAPRPTPEAAAAAQPRTQEPEYTQNYS